MFRFNKLLFHLHKRYSKGPFWKDAFREASLSNTRPFNYLH